MDIAKYKKLFLEEAGEHLKVLNDGFVRLEADPGALDDIDELFRHAHSMKGMASSMGYDPVGTLSHAMESVLDGIKKRSLKIDRALIDLLLAALDKIEKMVAEIDAADRISTSAAEEESALRRRSGLEKQAPSPEAAADLEEIMPELSPEPADLPADDAPHLKNEAEAFLNGLGAAAVEAIKASAVPPLAPYYMEVHIDGSSQSLSARGFIILNRLAKESILTAAAPDLESVRRGAASTRIQAVVLYADTATELKRRVSTIAEVRRVDMVAVGLAPRTPLKPPETSQAPAAGAVKIKKIETAARAHTLRVDTAILDKLINMVGELIISHERLNTLSAGTAQPVVGDELGRLGGIIRHFQETIMEVRMMPLELVAGRFPRMVRDLARKSGKEVTYAMEGLEIELDRAILEEVGEVMVHVLRNAVDHGLETPQERLAAGKPSEGKIVFRASREREWVLIQVSDDGRGIDLDAVRAKAMELGMVSREGLAAMDRDEILMLTATPGFSTAKVVTDISGRGVGLDAVRAKVESLGGSLGLESDQGRGATVTLRIPLSMAIIQVLNVAVADQIFGLPITRVHHAVELSPGQIKQTGDQEFFRDGGRLNPLRRLGRLLGLKDGRTKYHGPVVVVGQGKKRQGLLVDELLGSKDVVLKPLGQPLRRIPALAGATILGDGRPVLILDVMRLL